MTQSIGFLGTGRIAEPMIRSLSRRFPNFTILVSTRSHEISSRVQTLNNVSASPNQYILEQCEIVFICLLADVARKVLPQLMFESAQKVISVMADISLEEISSLIAPASNPCVTIPLPFIEQGGCPLPVYPESPTLETLFGDENDVITLSSENAIPPHFAATAILSSSMKQLDVVAHWLGEHAGSQRDGERYVANLVSGYLGAMPKDGADRFKQAMQDLSTEEGLNNQLRQHIMESGHYETLRNGLDELHRRLKAATG